MVSINNNMGGMRSMDALQQSHTVLQTSLERLSTGIRINRAEDDAAGLMVRDRFQAQVNGFEEGIRNIQTAQGMIQVAEQGLNKVTESLQQMRALAVRAADDNLNDEDRGRIQEQVKGLLKEINERAVNTSYNGHKLLDGSIADSHEERQGTAKVQGNSFLAQGATLVSGASTTGSAATTTNAISQGSYQVKLVFSGEHGVTASATSLTELKGTLNSGPNGDATADTTNLSQIVTDRNGGAHTASFTFTQVGDGSRNFNYTVNIAAGGVYNQAQAFTGTVQFNTDGSIAAVDNHAPSQTRDVTLGDGTAGGQAWSIDFGGLVENQHSTAGPAASATNNGFAGTQGGTITGSGNLDSDHVISDTLTTAAFNVVDRAGTEHSVSISYSKVSDTVAGETWSYSVNGLSGGVWNGDTSGNAAGTLDFSNAGGLLAINGGAPAAFNLRIDDGTSNGQTVAVDLTTVTNTNALDSHAGVGSGTQGTPTDTVTVRNNLINGSTPASFNFSVVDRTGQDTNTASITFSQTSQDSNTWNYTITAPSENNVDGFNGFGSNLQGTVVFDDAGNIKSLDGSSTLSKSITFNDRTAEQQQITMDFSRLNYAAADDFTNSISNGGTGTEQGDVSAVIYYSDGSGKTDLNPVSTLHAVDQKAASYEAGGIKIDVAQASTLDVGLTAYVKAHTYISATKEDKALTFQVGPDEGNVTRVGISKMDVQTIFRRNENDGGESGYTDVDLGNALKAQDLIGQIDDALNFVGGENLKVGQFQNKFSRTLELSRQQMTSITGALSNLNDADMAKEATNQSKRSILVQSGTAMVAQANTQGQFLLQLLR